GGGADGVGIDEPDTDDVRAAGVDELVEAVLARRVVLVLARLELLDLDAELLLGLVQALGRRVVERLVAATADVIGEAGLDVRSGARGLSARVTPAAGAQRQRGHGHDRCSLHGVTQGALHSSQGYGGTHVPSGDGMCSSASAASP